MHVFVFFFFPYGNVFLKLCICFGICLSSKWFPLGLTFFLFSNLGLIIAPQTSIHINCFMAGGWHTSCHPLSKMRIVGEGPGETPSALRCLSYLINSFLTDVKQLAETSRGRSPSPFWYLCQKLSVSRFYFNKTLLHRSSWVIKSWSLVPKPDLLQRSRIPHCSL